jgi:holliday junction DNA helicase RuvB
MNDQLTTPISHDEEEEYDRSLRPQSFSDFAGQESAKEQLSIALEAAKKRGEALDHVLLAGPPGLGKTTLAYIIANEMGVDIRTTSGPVLEKKGDLAALLTDLDKHAILFIDEIHRLQRVVEECLYPAMEDGVIDVIVGEGPHARSFKIPIKPFTLIGATTREGALSAPLRDRFGLHMRLRFYSEEEMNVILLRSANMLKAQYTEDGIAEIAARSRRTPRIANRLLRRVRDYAEVRADGIINQQVTQKALEILEVDDLGLDFQDREILRVIIELHNGGPVGLKSIAAAIGEDAGTLEEVYEPFLIQIGLMSRTPAGRTATARAYMHMGHPAPPDEMSLF